MGNFRWRKVLTHARENFSKTPKSSLGGFKIFVTNRGGGGVKRTDPKSLLFELHCDFAACDAVLTQLLSDITNLHSEVN